MQWDHTPSVEEEALAKKLFKETEDFWEAARKRQYPKDSPEINKLFNKYGTLADMGNIDAMYLLGNLYHKDFTDFFDREELAVYYLKKAANLGHKEAMYDLGCKLNEEFSNWYNEEQATEWFEKAANLGHYPAMYELVKILKKDEPWKAYEWLDKITDNPANVFDARLADAYYLQAELQWSDERLIPDYERAIELYRIAAFNKHYKAALKLGILYEKGYTIDNKTIVKPDMVSAGFYMITAYENEHKYSYLRQATFRYARMLNTGSGVSKNYKKAFQLFYEAACGRNGAAMVEYADFFCSGKLFEPDLEMAFLWLLISQSFNCYGYSNHRDEKILELEPKLNRKRVIELQDKAQACVNMIKSYGDFEKSNLIPTAFEKSNLIPTAEEYLAEHIYLNHADQEPASAEATDADNQAERVNWAHKNEKAFLPLASEMEKIRKDLKPEDVEFRIWIDKKIPSVEAMDFSVLKVKYKDYDLQVKNMKIYSNTKKICEKARNLLIRLAIAQNPDLCQCRDEGARLIKRIIQADSTTEVSALNRLYKLLFYNGKTVKKSPMIDKEKGILKIQLKFCCPDKNSVSGFLPKYNPKDLIINKKS
jgi:TPR repeat protein